MKRDELRDDKIIKEWFLLINTKPTTERNYLSGMRWFTEWTGKTPSMLLDEAEAEIKSGVLMRHRSIKMYLAGFRKHLQETGRAPQTVRSLVSGVMSFYNAFEIEIPKQTRASSKATTLKKHKDIPTRSEMIEVLRVCDPLERAVVLVGLSSGLSGNEIINLKIKDFKKGYDPETGITTLDLRREKVEFDFITFLTPEASKAVLDYLQYRSRTDKRKDLKRIDQLKKQRIYSDDDYLFIKRHIDPEFLVNCNDSLRKHDIESLVKVYRNVSEKAQKNTPKGDWNLIRSHTMRKYFNSTLLNAGCDSFHTEFFMGHTLDDTRAAYFRASPEKLRDIYSKYIPYLTVMKEADVSESPEYLKMKQEHEILQRETARHIVERSELQEVKARLQKIEQEEQIRKKRDKDFDSQTADIDLSDPEIQAKFMLHLMKSLKQN